MNIIIGIILYLLAATFVVPLRKTYERYGWTRRNNVDAATALGLAFLGTLCIFF
jgi:hypothetical protein